MPLPIMARATAVWLVDNTTLTFKQISDFCGLHELEVHAIADDDTGVSMKGFDPISNNQLTREEISRGEASPIYKLQLMDNPVTKGEEKRRGPRYTPLSKRQDRPAGILWLVKFHPELSDVQISKLVGTTKPTIKAMRERTHWDINNIQPIDPVALGLCKQVDLHAAVEKAVAKMKKDGTMPVQDLEGEGLVNVEESLGGGGDQKMPSAISGLENFSFGAEAKSDGDEADSNAPDDAEALFNLPKSSK